MKTKVIQSQSIFTKQESGFLHTGPFPFTHTSSPYTGCGFGGTYCGSFCYAPSMGSWSQGHGVDAEWGQLVVIKGNAGALAADELAKMGSQGRATLRVFMASTTDPYQPLEAEHRITRSILEAFSKYNDIGLLCIQTRSNLVERDFDLTRSFRRKLDTPTEVTFDANESFTLHRAVSEETVEYTAQETWRGSKRESHWLRRGCGNPERVTDGQPPVRQSGLFWPRHCRSRMPKATDRPMGLGSKRKATHGSFGGALPFCSLPPSEAQPQRGREERQEVWLDCVLSMKRSNSSKQFTLLRKRLQLMGLNSYEEYLASEVWKQTRERYRVRRFRGYCESCGQSIADFQLHHMSYARIPFETLRDFVALCGFCHRDIHDLCRRNADLSLKTAFFALRKQKLGIECPPAGKMDFSRNIFPTRPERLT